MTTEERVAMIGYTTLVLTMFITSTDLTPKEVIVTIRTLLFISEEAMRNAGNGKPIDPDMEEVVRKYVRELLAEV